MPLVTAVLAACGGGSTNAPIGGTLSGLDSGQSVTLQDNGSDNLTLIANGTFSFAGRISDDSTYNVTVVSQPTGQTCQLANASGTVDSTGDAVTSVSVACVDTSSVGGTVSGLATGTAVTLSNGSVLLPVGANGSFAFPGILLAGTTYTVTVAVQPAGETCTVTNGSGIYASGTVTNIAVTCSAGT
jgi:hypothetical protein